MLLASQVISAVGILLMVSALAGLVVRRRYAEGTALQAIAVERGMTANAVMQALFRIRQSLMHCVARYSEGSA